MSAPLSNELFFQAHRGMRIKPEEVQTDNLGMHWSENYNVARNFARSMDEEESKKGVIYHANIPMSSVETRPSKLQLHDVHTHPESREYEVPVEQGRSVLVTGKTHLRLNPKFNPSTLESGYKVKKRKRTYNPPREMKA